MRLISIALAAVASLLLIGAPAKAQTLTWTGAGDGTTFGSAANWSPAVAPTSTHDLIIPAGAAINITASHTVHSITTDRALLQTGGCASFTITNGLTFTSAAGSLTTSSAGCQTLFFNGTQSITGPGTLNLNSGVAVVSGAATTLTVGPGVIVQAGNAGGQLVINSAGATVVNQGTFRANAAGRTLSITGDGSFTNAAGGSVQATATGTLSLRPANWTNNGTLLINDGSFTVGGTYSALGAVNRTAGSFTMIGSYTGATLTANASTGVIGFGPGLVISNTVLNGADGQSFAQAGSITLNAITLNTSLAVNSGCSSVTVTGGLTLGAAGSMTTGSAGCQTLVFSGTQTVSGSGTLTLNSGSAVVSGASAVLTIGPGVVVQAGNSAAQFLINNANSSLINQGIFRANAAGRTFTIVGDGTFTNAPGGTVEASGTGTFSLRPDAWVNNGTFFINDGAFGVGGTYNALGTLNRTGGSFTLTGSYTGATLTANASTGAIVLGNNLTLSNTVINGADGQGFAQGGTVTLNAVTLNAPLSINSGCSSVTVSGGLTLGGAGALTTGAAGCQTLVFSGTQTVGGAGTITLNSGSAVVSGANATLTLGSGIILQAGNAGGQITTNTGNAIVNNGVMRANAAGRTLSISGAGSLTNSPGASIEASNGGTVNITIANWTNSGAYVINEGTLNLSGTYSSLGTVNRTNGTFNLAGTYTGGTLTANAVTGSINLGGNAVLSGTTLNASGGAGFVQSGNFTLDNTTINAPISVTSGCSTVVISGGLVMGPGGSITTGNAGCQTLLFSGTQTVSGAGTITLNSGSAVVTGSGAVLTLGPGILVQAGNASGQFFVNTGNALINQGTMRANAAGRTLAVSGTGGAFTVAPGGTIEASGTGALNINQVNWTNNGTLVVNNGTANLGGTSAGLGTISRSGGTINFTGTYTGPVLTISNVTGPITFGGGTTFSGTTLNAIDGQTFSLSGNAAFEGVTLNAPISLNAGCSTLTVSSGLTFGGGGAITTGNAGCQTLLFSGTQTIGGTGTITLNSGSAAVTGSGSALTLGPGITVLAGNNSSQFMVNTGNALINQGAMRANAAGRTLTLSGPGSLTNASGGVLEVSNTATLTINQLTWANNGTLVVNNGTANLGGTCAGLGAISRSGGAINLIGNYTGPVLTISNATGAIGFGGGITFTGTTLNALDGLSYVQTGNLNFEGVTLNAPFLMTAGCSTLTISGGFTLGSAGSITTGNAGCQTLIFSGTQTVGGTGRITLNSGSAAVNGTNATLTFGPGVTLEAGNTFATLLVNDGNAVVNQGLMLATGSTRRLNITLVGTLGTGTFTNQGIVESQNAADVVFNITATNHGRIRAGAGAFFTVPANRTFTNAADGTVEIQGTSPNSTTGFGHVRVSGNFVADGHLSVTYPNGHIPGCRINVPVVTSLAGGTITGTFDDRVGPPKPSPYAVRFGFTPTGVTFSSTNVADVGSAGGTPGADGLLDNNDFIVFINLYFNTDPVADFGKAGGLIGPDGLFDNNDFIAYITLFFDGCD